GGAGVPAGFDCARFGVVLGYDEFSPVDQRDVAGTLPVAATRCDRRDAACVQGRHQVGDLRIAPHSGSSVRLSAQRDHARFSGLAHVVGSWRWAARAASIAASTESGAVYQPSPSFFSRPMKVSSSPSYSSANRPHRSRSHLYRLASACPAERAAAIARRAASEHASSVAEAKPQRGACKWLRSYSAASNSLAICSLPILALPDSVAFAAVTIFPALLPMRV